VSSCLVVDALCHLFLRPNGSKEVVAVRSSALLQVNFGLLNVLNVVLVVSGSFSVASA